MIERKRKRAVQLVTQSPQFYGAAYGTWLDTHDYEAAADEFDDLTATELRRAVVLTREAAGAPTLSAEVVATLAKSIADARDTDASADRYEMQIRDDRL